MRVKYCHIVIVLLMMEVHFLCMPSQGAPPESDAEVPVKRNSIGMQLIEIPAGEFFMGAEEDQAETVKAFPDFPYRRPFPNYEELGAKLIRGETPQHRVRISTPFAIGKCEVTLGQFTMFVKDANYKTENERYGAEDASTIGSDGCSGIDAQGNLVQSRRFRPWKPEGWTPDENHPVTFVSWNDANAFCAWLSAKEKVTYRLPTEAEWEYVCRAGTRARFHCGNDPEALVRFDNVMDADAGLVIGLNTLLGLAYRNMIKQGKFLASGDGYAWLAPVGSFQPNAFGICDMHGNASEWCSDRYDAEYYKTSPINDPPGPREGKYRVIRGGGFLTPPILMRCARRDFNEPTNTRWDLGFRVLKIQ